MTMTKKQNFEQQLKYGLFHFEPLLMSYLDHDWVHPLIDHDKYGPADTHNGLPTGTFHRIWIHFGDKTTATLVVTSRAIDRYWAGFGGELKNLKCLIEACLLEDTWTSTDGVVFSGGGEQFYYTEFGKLMRQAFGKGKWSLEISRFEIGTITLEDDGYSFVTHEEMAAQARMASRH
jgi:hypothetical protein